MEKSRTHLFEVNFCLMYDARRPNYVYGVKRR